MVARNKYRPVHLRYSWLLVRLFRCNHDLGAVHAAETLDGDTDHPHLLMVSPRQAERADAAAAALPLACTGGSRAPTALASLHARDGICEQLTAYAAFGSGYDRPRLGRWPFSLGLDAVSH